MYNEYNHQHISRTFVNLLQVIDITRLAPLRGLVCDAVHFFVCTCYNDEETSDASTEYQVHLIDCTYNSLVHYIMT